MSSYLNTCSISGVPSLPLQKEAILVPGHPLWGFTHSWGVYHGSGCSDGPLTDGGFQHSQLSRLLATSPSVISATTESIFASPDNSLWLSPQPREIEAGALQGLFLLGTQLLGRSGRISPTLSFPSISSGLVDGHMSGELTWNISQPQGLCQLQTRADISMSCPS